MGVTDLETGKPVVIRDGKVAVAVHASCAVPGIVVPVRDRGRIWGDGGISFNLPGSAARAMGADYVIGVDLLQPKPAQTRRPIALWPHRVGGDDRAIGRGPDSVDCLIMPELAGFTYFDSGRFEDLLARGRQAATDKLDEIRAALQAPTTDKPQSSDR